MGDLYKDKCLAKQNDICCKSTLKNTKLTLNSCLQRVFIAKYSIEHDIALGGQSMKTEQQYFDGAISIQQYMDNMTTLKEESFRIYDGFEVPLNDGFIELLKDKQPKILTITEDWCGDAMLNNPVIRRVAEAAGLDMRAVLRDADTDLIDRYLTNGGRAIPVYILLDDAGHVVGKWGPRAPELQELVVSKRATLPDKEDPTFEDAQKALYAEIREENITNKAYWTFVYEDFKKQVTAALQ